MVAHTNQCLFFGFDMTRGNYKAFCIGGVLSKMERTLEWKLRMKVDFHHKFVVNNK